MNSDKILGYCDEIDSLTQLIREEVLAPVQPVEDVIVAGEDLQAALDHGGALALETGAAFTAPGGYRVTVPQTSVRGLGGNHLTADTAPAIAFPPGMRQGALATVAITVTRHEVGVQVGRNDDAQTTLDVVPRGVRFHAVQSSGHRGKRAFEINAGDVEILDCEVHDLFDPAGRDSQAIWIGNAPGPVRVEGGYFEAASENLLVGGDAMKIPNCRPTGLTIRHATFHKRLAWQVGGPPVKNILELKDGHDVLIEQCDLAFCWKSGQDGYGLMLTPTRGGSLRNVVIRDCAMREVGGIVNITGIDAGGGTPRTQVHMIGGTYRTNKAAMGGPGRFALVTRGPEWFRVDGLTVEHEGASFVDVADKAPVDVLSIVNSTWNYGTYGVRIGGYSHGDNQLGLVAALIIEGNTISGAHSAFRARYPNNTYLAMMTRDDEQRAAREEDDERRLVDDEVRRLQEWLRSEP